MIPKNYPKEFVERTLKLIDIHFKEVKATELEVTFLLNCLLGLIISTYENSENDDYFTKTKLRDKDLIPHIPKSIAIITMSKLTKNIKEELNKSSLMTLDAELKINNVIKIEKYEQLENLTLKEFTRYLRNGIAHQNIMPTSDNEHWKGIRIWNHNNLGIKDFEVEFKISELKKFAIFIGKKFLEKYNK